MTRAMILAVTLTTFGAAGLLAPPLMATAFGDPAMAGGAAMAEVADSSKPVPLIAIAFGDDLALETEAAAPGSIGPARHRLVCRHVARLPAFGIGLACGEATSQRALAGL